MVAMECLPWLSLSMVPCFCEESRTECNEGLNSVPVLSSYVASKIQSVCLI